MSRYYGVRIESANCVKYNSAHNASLCTTDDKIAWFVTEDSALRYADEMLQKRYELLQTHPELAERETTTLPGLAFIYITDTVCITDAWGPEHEKTDIPNCIGIGGTDGVKAATFIYCPPPCIALEYGYRPYMYFIDDNYIRTIVDAYDKNNEIVLPEEYQPKLAKTESSEDVPVYVHYGNTVFDPDKFHAAYTRMHDFKPEEGLWASSTHAKFSWIDWCQSEHYCDYQPNDRMEFTLTPDAKVFQVNTLTDIAYLLKYYPAPYESTMLFYNTYIEHGLPCLAVDYEAMRKDFDGIEYNYSALGNIMGPWDCDSTCIFNPDVMHFREIELVPEEEFEYTEEEYQEEW